MGYYLSNFFIFFFWKVGFCNRENIFLWAIISFYGSLERTDHPITFWRAFQLGLISFRPYSTSTLSRTFQQTKVVCSNRWDWVRAYAGWPPCRLRGPGSLQELEGPLFSVSVVFRWTLGTRGTPVLSHNLVFWGGPGHVALTNYGVIIRHGIALS